MTRQDMLIFLAKECEEWSRDDLIQFVFCRLYDEYSQYSDLSLKELIGATPSWETLLELNSKEKKD